MNRKLFEYSYTLKKQKQKQFFFVLFYLILIYAAVNLILYFLIYPVRQKSMSMMPDIPQNSLVFVTPLDTTPERGDVVVVKSMCHEELSPVKKVIRNIVSTFTAQQIQLYESEDQPGCHPVIRRVIGMPGDTIYMRDYVLYIKSKENRHFLTEFEIIDKAYNVTFFAAPSDWSSDLGVKGSFDEITLGNDEYFVLGDNRKSATDSRLWGALDKSEICGKALLCYFPIKSFKIF